jgi:hypothetical protein
MKKIPLNETRQFFYGSKTHRQRRRTSGTRLAAGQNRGAAEEQADDARWRSSGEEGVGQQDSRQLGCGMETRPPRAVAGTLALGKQNAKTAALRHTPATQQTQNRKKKSNIDTFGRRQLSRAKTGPVAAQQLGAEWMN